MILHIGLLTFPCMLNMLSHERLSALVCLPGSMMVGKQHLAVLLDHCYMLIQAVKFST